MSDRILKDIRFYESEKQNIEGQSIPRQLGKLFVPTKDTNFIGQRIARKLNELKFTYGEFDHIYINLTTVLKENEIVVSNRNVDKRIKYLDFGINVEKLQSLSDSEKNSLIKSITFQALRKISNDLNLALVDQTEKLISELDTEIKIHFKTKETKSFKIDIYYQIEVKEIGTMAVIEYKDKKNNFCGSMNYKLQFYEDIYTLIDTISIAKGLITLKPKKSFTADLNNKRYETPIQLELSDFKVIVGV
ncbi:hypothetical protein [Flavobacterium sp. N502540]|uniref:hypothetical protein n=1 Tax=Flavobacterium sp. N502540 TaxID=2986838 RepID=UPI002224BDA8|nr:hypothetical protein [Flavobacterium sp. N502540]